MNCKACNFYFYKERGEKRACFFNHMARVHAPSVTSKLRISVSPLPSFWEGMVSTQSHKSRNSHQAIASRQRWPPGTLRGLRPERTRSLESLKKDDQQVLSQGRTFAVAGWRPLSAVRTKVYSVYYRFLLQTRDVLSFANFCELHAVTSRCWDRDSLGTSPGWTFLAQPSFSSIYAQSPCKKVLPRASPSGSPAWGNQPRWMWCCFLKKPRVLRPWGPPPCHPLPPVSSPERH